MAPAVRIVDLCSERAIVHPKDVLISVAESRGCKDEAALKQFFNPPATFENPIAAVAGYELASARIARAILSDESISIYGDYDVDGQTSIVLMLDLLRAAGSKKIRVFVPDRVADDYGLTEIGVQRCIEAHSPTLIISVDCGSPSYQVIADLKTRGIDTIVIDHHNVPPYVPPFPAIAHLNPKDPNSGVTGDLQELSAAGLVFLFCDRYAAERSVTSWDRARAFLLGGLGTFVDVMPLRGLNRVLVKGSLALANRGDLLTRTPGLELLREKQGVKEVNSWAYGFIFGPALNATGRIANAQTSISLLSARSAAKAEPFVDAAIARNKERREIQKDVVDEAMAQAQQQIDNNPSRRIIVTANKNWHPGVVGIVAGRIKEKFRRPAFVCGWHEEGYWKGSGRSTEAFNLGAIVQRAVASKALLGGGGHHMAAGIRIAEDGLPSLISWLDDMTREAPMDLSETFFVMGEADLFQTAQWHEVYRRLEPFGNGNPRPHLWLPRATLDAAPKELTKSGDTVWALKGSFIGSRRMPIEAVWTNVSAAREQWTPGRTYRLVLGLSKKEKKFGSGYYDRWDVVHCMALD